MLVRDLVFLEEFLHLLGDHVSIVRDRDERDLFPSFRLLWLFRLLGVFRFLTHV